MIALAVIKPWGSPGSSLDGRGAQVGPTARPTPVVGPTGTPRTLATCFNDAEWRLVTAERSVDREVRTWVAVSPTVASGPSDTRLRAVRIVADQLVGLGFCAPSDTRATLDGAHAVLWVPRPAAPQPQAFAGLEPLSGYDDGVGGGQLRQPRPAASGGPRTWPPGSYAIEIKAVESDRPSLWFAFRVVAPPSSQPTPRDSR